MPDRARVEEFIKAVESDRHVEAIENFYHDDASMQENDQPPREGRDAIVAHEKKSLEGIQRMETRPACNFLVDGDLVVIHWVFILMDLQGKQRQLEEISLQSWRGNRIASERFFYDSAKAWQVLES